MIRAFYRLLLWLHPPSFRRQYAAEMLWIFDASRHENGALPLFADAGISFCRQWCLRTRWWLVPVTVACSLVTLLTGNAVLRLAFRRIARGHAASPQELFLFATALSVLTVCLIVIVFVNSFLRARRHA